MAAKEPTVEPGRLAYEAWCGTHGCDQAWRCLHLMDKAAWAAAEAASGALAAEKAWDEGAEAGMGYLNVSFASTSLAARNPYRLPAKGDGNGQ